MKFSLRNALSVLLILALAAGMFAAAPVLAAETGEPLEEVEWYYRAFGQSTDIFFNNVSNGPGQNGINNVWVNPDWLDDHGLDSTFVQSEAQRAQALTADEPVLLEDGDRVVVESRGGKIASGHDGMTFFYTILPTDRNYVLTAEVTKLAYGVNPDNTNGVTSANNQSGGGMIARDMLGEPRQDPAVEGFEELPAISNFAGIRFNQTGVGASYRDGCVSPVSAIGIVPPTLSDTVDEPVGAKMTYTLERRDDGFYMTICDEDGNEVRPETLITENADLVQRVDKEYMYWGFFAAREARLLVENVTLLDTGEADITESEPPTGANQYDPAIVLKSRTETGLEAYTLALRPNYAGTLTVTRGGTQIYSGGVKGYQEVYIETTLAAGDNTFTCTFTPDDESAPNQNPVTETITVTLTDNPSAGWEAIWASAAGGGDGSAKDSPMAYTDAVTAAEPGQTIYLVDGDYSAIQWTIGDSSGESNGVPDALITLRPEPGVETVKFQKIDLASSYWHLKDIVAGGTSDTDRSDGSPITISGDYNLLEGCVGEWGSGTGVHTGGASADHRDMWPKYNVFLNCIARYNVDPAGNNADGFAAKRVGPGVEYHGCVSHNNVDDGWDFFNTTDSGPSYPILIENCVAFDNDHNGFKLGGEMQPAGHVVRDSIAYGNGMAGFSCNFNPGEIRITGCVSIDNLDQNYLLRDNIYIDPANTVTGSISYRTDPEIGKDDYISGTVVNSALCVGGVSTLNGVTLTDDMFASLDRADAYTYDGDGNLVRGDYGRFLGWATTHEPYIKGYDNGTFRPYGGITRAEAAQLIYNISGGPEAAQDAPRFTDVPESEWYFASVTYLAGTGAIEGDGDGAFRPDDTITRAEFTALVVRYLGLTPEGVPSFPDVEADSWAAPYIAIAEKEHLVEGDDGLFNPENDIVRAEAVTLTNRLLGRTVDESLYEDLENPFSDVPRTEWFWGDIMEAAVAHTH